MLDRRTSYIGRSVNPLLIPLCIRISVEPCFKSAAALTVQTLIRAETETKFCQGKDVLERMNYLYQASHLMALRNKVASSYYGNMMVGCARKAVLRMEPSIKRTLCKCCQTPLIPGETARVRLISKPIKSIKWTCLTCMNTKRFPIKKGYKLWLDEPQAVIETLDYTPKLKKETVQQSDLQTKTLTVSQKNKEVK